MVKMEGLAKQSCYKSVMMSLRMYMHRQAQQRQRQAYLISKQTLVNRKYKADLEFVKFFNLSVWILLFSLNTIIQF